MGFRTVYGNTISEDGWRMVDQDECVWVEPCPGVSLQLRSGVPATILGAFAKRFNEVIEPLRDADTGGWTLVNDVATSNHLAGTAMDLNWQSHPFHAQGTFGNKLPALIKLLKEFEGCVWWGGNWTDPIDEMHFQLNYEEGDQRLIDLAKKLSSSHAAPVTPPAVTPPTTGVFMALTDAEQHELLDLARQQSGIRRTSRSPLRHVGEGPVETISGFEWNTDGSVHVLLVALLARLGHPDTLKLLNEVATNTVADRQQDKKLAQAILNWIAQVSNPTVSTPMSPVQPTPLMPSDPSQQPVTVSVPMMNPVVAPLQTSGAGLYSEVNSLRTLIRDVTNSLSSTTKGE